MKKGGGKRKGGAWERVVAKELSLWLSDGKRDDLFWRSAMSGGRATVSRKRGKNNVTQVGDISAVDPAGSWLIENFVIECKFYKDLESGFKFLMGKGRLHEFWAQVWELAMGFGKEPMLVARQNKTPAYVLMTKNGAELLGCDPSHCLASFMGDKDGGAVVYLFSDVMRHAIPYGGKKPVLKRRVAKAS